MDKKLIYLKDLYENENLHRIVYGKLVEVESSPKLKSALRKLSEIEGRHESLWKRLLEMNGIKPVERDYKLSTVLIVALRRVIGLALTIKLIEYFEKGLESKFDEVKNSMPLNKDEAAIVKVVYDDENLHERKLEEMLVSQGRIINNIRDVAFGMNDGLVELLAVVVGLAAALTTPLLIILGGVIVSVSGTLSMGAGAYLSTEYENSLNKMKDKKDASMSAIYVGVMYFIGTLFPLSPFFLGITGYPGIALSIIITAIVLAITSAVIAIIGEISILGRVSKTLLISLGIDAITIAIGLYARAVLNLPATV
jgi:VIT1/CCC1 family predicted Fe2+/Mn2+ transporter